MATDLTTVRSQLQTLLTQTQSKRQEMEIDYRISRKHTGRLKKQLQQLDEQVCQIRNYLTTLDRIEGLVN